MSTVSTRFASFLLRIGEYLNYIAFFAVLFWIWFDKMLTNYDRALGNEVEAVVWRIVWTTLLVHFVQWLLTRLQPASQTK